MRLIAIDCLAHRCIVAVEDALEGYRPQEAVSDVLNRVRPPHRYKRGD